ncbi:IclR family transcriptional regulator [uncultured Serinicoccus sp.]|uniref:IclR family transcriptional regulator n=1 Tax=uncultured Serinicoccus sp. TaxID=735514 RepID=UPI00260DDAC0|nr:helix-turn-helix domain-containing protein [uncultured Serinicoccus sp.]
MAAGPPVGRDVPASQTLSRGIRVLEVLADAGESLTIDDIAGRLEVHRSVAYRLVRTLEHHGLVVRDSSGRIELGARLAALAAGVTRDLQAQALPELTAVANDLGMTCFLSLLDRDEAITIASIEPRHAVASVAQRPGARHPVTVGAPGKAILAQVPLDQWPDGVGTGLVEEVRVVGTQGYATSHDEVIRSVQSVAVPLALRDRPPAALAVVHVVDSTDPRRVAERLSRSADAIRTALQG